MSIKSIAFSPHNPNHLNFFLELGNHLKDQYGFDIAFIHELGAIEGEKVFQFDDAIKKIWSTIDISYSNLIRLEKKYPQCNFMRALYSERRTIFFPKYFSDKPISYEAQLKYLVGCFNVFEEWLSKNKIDCIISELLIGLPDSILYSVCQEMGIKYISLRSSKVLPGVIMCEPDNDQPMGMLNIYKEYIQNGIPEKYYDSANSHIESVRSKIKAPHYMQKSKKNYKLVRKTTFQHIISRLTKTDIQTNEISLTQKPLRQEFLWKLHRFLNIKQTGKNKAKWFDEKIPPDEKYLIFPLQYEPENSTLIRAFPFSDQLCVIQQIAKALPLGVSLLVKEHMGNHGYRKPHFYKELYYLPNVKLVPREANINNLLSNSLGVVTLTSRMGWEALINSKPVIALGTTFWTDFDAVRKPNTWLELKNMIKDCCNSSENEMNISGYEEKLSAYTAAYISRTHNGNFVISSDAFFSQANIANIAQMLTSLNRIKNQSEELNH
jgi:hypothetical protein